MTDNLKKIIEHQRIEEKKGLGTISTIIWFVFIIVQLVQNNLDFFSLKTLLMLVPGIFIGAFAMIIPYLILFRGFVSLSVKFRFSRKTMIISRYIKSLIEIIFAWYAAQFYFQIINYYI